MPSHQIGSNITAKNENYERIRRYIRTKGLNIKIQHMSIRRLLQMAIEIQSKTICNYSLIQFNLMRLNKTYANILSKIAELIVQHRIEVKAYFLECVQLVREELESPEVYAEGIRYALNCLIRTQYYGIKQKVLNSNLKEASKMGVVLTFTAVGKRCFQIISQEIWSIEIESAHHTTCPSHSNYQSVGLLNQLIVSLQSQQLYSKIISDRHFKQKCIIDYTIDIRAATKAQALGCWTNCYWQRGSSIDKNAVLRVNCYHHNFEQPIWRFQQNQSINSLTFLKCKFSEETRSGSESYSSSQDQDHMIQIGSALAIDYIEKYDEELQLTIITKAKQQPIAQFALDSLPQEESSATSKFEILADNQILLSKEYEFIDQNQSYFRDWIKYEADSYFN